MRKKAILVNSFACILAVTSIVCFSIRVQSQKTDKATTSQSLWNLSISVSLDFLDTPKFRIPVPDNTNALQVQQELISCQGIWYDILRDKETAGRYIAGVLVKQDSDVKFNASYRIVQANDFLEPVPITTAPLSVSAKYQYLKKEKGIPANDEYVNRLLGDIQKSSQANTKIHDEIFRYCCEMIHFNPDVDYDDVRSVLLSSYGNSLGKARAMVSLCRTAKVPARLTAGYVLEANPQAQWHYWVEVLEKNLWIPYDPTHGFERKLPGNFMPFLRQNSIKSFLASSFSDLQVQIEKYPSRQHEGGQVIHPVLDFYQMTPDTKNVIKRLLLLTIGTLVVTFFRNFIGIQTFGTFAPVLLVLGFVDMDWKTGLLVFFILLSTGIGIRYLIQHFKLLLVSRLSIILVILILCMVLVISVLSYYKLMPSAHSILFPLVIMTMMIERIVVMSEEDGIPNALKASCGTVLVSFCVWVLILRPQLGEWVLRYPEIQLMVLALLLLSGRYSGYRLTELFRFRDMAVIHPEIKE